MLFLNFGSSNILGRDVGLARDGEKTAGDSGTLCSSHNRILQQSAHDQKLTYSALKRLWMIGRRNSEDDHKTTQKERRISFSGQKQELITPVGDNSDWWQKDRKKCVSFKFWRNEEEEDYLVVARQIDVSSFKDVDRLSELVRARYKRKNCSATEIAEMFQSIYRVVGTELRKKVVFCCLSPDKRNSLFATFEQYFMRNFHQELFSKITEEEQECDQKLSAKIGSLYWIKMKNLEAKLNETDPLTWQYLDQAMLDLASINFKESVAEKMACIMNCSRWIFDLLRVAEQEGGADGFLPILIYVVLQANPAHLRSNVRYILQFANTDRVMKGEEGYYFTHLCSVVSYIENLNSESLGMTNEEFSRYLRESNSAEGNYGLQRRRLARYICDIYHKAAEQRVLGERQDALWKRSLALQQKMEKLKEDLAAHRVERERNREDVRRLMSVRYVQKPSCPQCLRRSLTV